MSLCGDSGRSAAPRLPPRAAQMARRPELLCGAAVVLGCALLVALKVTCRSSEPSTRMLDGMHIAIQALEHSGGGVYVNRKGYHLDTKVWFMDICVSWSSCTHNTRVFLNLGLGCWMAEETYTLQCCPASWLEVGLPNVPAVIRACRTLHNLVEAKQELFVQGWATQAGHGYK